VKNSSPEECDKQLSATVAALIGVGPRDELEGMMAARLIAAHSAAIECYRRAMIGEQTFEGRRENLAQANKLVRAIENRGAERNFPTSTRPRARASWGLILHG
jgi:hypothetical protein